MTFLIAFAAVAGNCKLWSEFANRIHAQPWSCRTLRRIRWLHDIGLLGFPFLLAWVLWKCDWSFAELIDRSIASWFVLPACAIGFVWLAIDAARYLFLGRPRGTEIVASRVHNLLGDKGASLTGDAKRSYWAKLPYNEIFHVEVNHKRLRHPRFTADKPLRILHLTDWHFSGTPDRAYYEAVTELIQEHTFDLAVFTGDLMDRMNLTDWIGTTLGRINAPLGCHFILGNHDWFIEHDKIRSQLKGHGWSDVGSKVSHIEHDGIRIAMAGNERPWLGEAPDLVTANADFRIAMIHTPDLLGWAHAQDADIVLAGHNHGGQVVLPVIGPVYSPSRHGVRYAGGLYRRGGTLMHVGRGLGGVHPVRWRCRPEITVIEIAGTDPVGDAN